MRNSLYDSYRLSNSTAIPLYQGSAAPEALAVGQHLQGLYDTARAGAGEVSSALDNLQYLNQDEAVANEIRKDIQGKIDSMAASRDWENQVEAVRGLGRTYASRARELAAPMQQYQKWLENEVENKDKNLTPQQKEDLKARAMAGYGGLKKDASGRLVGGFSGIGAAKNIDVNKKIDEAMDGIAVAMGGKEIINDNGIWMIKRGEKWEELKAETIQNTLQAYLNNDQEYQAYKSMMGANTAFRASRNYTSIDQIDPKLQPAVQKELAKGYSFAEATARVFDTLQQDQIENTAHAYAVTKYQKDNLWVTRDQNANAYGLADYNRQQDDFRLMGSGANTVPDWAADPKQLTEEIQLSETEIGKLGEQKAILERQLANAPKGSQSYTQLQAQIDRVQGQIDQNQKVLDNNKAMWNNSRDMAVRELKMSDGNGGMVATYDQYVETTTKRLTIDISRKLPKGITVQGKHYTPEQLARAVAEGRYSEVEEMQGEAGVMTVRQLRMPDGTVLRGGDFGKIVPTIDKAQQQASKVEKTAHNLHGTAIKNFSVTSNSIGFTEGEQKAIGAFGISSGTVYAAPGSNKVYTDKDVRDKLFVPERFNVETGRMTGRFKDKDGNLTTPMDVKMDSNLANELRLKIAKNNKDGKWNAALLALDDASYSGPLTRVKPNSVLSGVPDANGFSTSKPLMWGNQPMELVLDVQGGSREWILRHKGGDIVKDQDGNQYRTNSITEADSWLRQLSTPQKK